MSDEPRPLHLIRFRIDPIALSAFAARERLLDDDLGYALHVAMRRTFGGAGPQPVRVLKTAVLAGRESVPIEVLGYTEDPDALTAPDVALPDWSDDWSAKDPSPSIFPEPPASRPMPTKWRAGVRYGFEVQVRPVRRASAGVRPARGPIGAERRAGERDAFLSAIDAADGGTVPSREAVYRGWLAERLEAAVELEEASLVRFRRTTVRRSAHVKGNTRAVEGPEALMRGRLRVRDAASFDRLLRRGVGRHVAFGYGMLLLRPDGVG